MGAVLEKQILPSHLAIGEDGIVRVAGTGLKVRLLAGHHRYHGYTAEQLTQAHVDLTLGQAHSVLAYYYDHKAEMDADMDRRNEMAERMRAEAEETPFVTRMKAAGILPHQETPAWEQAFAKAKADKEF